MGVEPIITNLQWLPTITSVPLDKNEDFKNNLVTHISVKPNYFFNTLKLLVIEKFDVKEVFQNLFLDYDWIWKTLVFGNILDFYFIKRLKSDVNHCSESTQENFGNDSDMVNAMLLTLIDRCGDDDNLAYKMYEYIKSFPSKLNLDLDLDNVFSHLFRKEKSTKE